MARWNIVRLLPLIFVASMATPYLAYFIVVDFGLGLQILTKEKIKKPYAATQLQNQYRTLLKAFSNEFCYDVFLGT
jgi:hypothetical protein